MTNTITYKCRIGKMGDDGKIIWIPKRFNEFFNREEQVEITIRKMV